MNDQASNSDGNKSENKPFQWRKNVLVLAGMSYGAVFLIFAIITWKCDVNLAFDAVQAALMALVGGSLAIAKDLID